MDGFAVYGHEIEAIGDTRHGASEPLHAWDNGHGARRFPYRFPCFP